MTDFLTRQRQAYEHLIVKDPAPAMLEDAGVAVTGRVPPDFYADCRRTWLDDMGAWFVSKDTKAHNIDLCIVGLISSRDFPSKTLRRVIERDVPVIEAKELEKLYERYLSGDHA